MISVIQLRPPAELTSFHQDAQIVLAALGARPGFLRGSLGRAYDDDDAWILVTEWESVGAYRRGLGAYEVKLVATPLMAHAVDQPSAFEELGVLDSEGRSRTATSDRAAGPKPDRAVGPEPDRAVGPTSAG